MTTPTPPVPSEQPPQQTSTMRFGDLKKLIGDTVREVTGGGETRVSERQQRQTQPPNARERVRDARSNIDDDVADALKKIEAEKKRREREEALDKDISDLKERTKEKPPVERSRVHRFMGWGE